MGAAFYVLPERALADFDHLLVDGKALAHALDGVLDARCRELGSARSWSSSAENRKW